MGTLESPIALTNTLNVGLVQDALVEYMVNRCKKDEIQLKSFNPVVGECNDSALNDICDRAVKQEHVFSAIKTASEDFDQGDVGAGKGTICFGFKGGIGSASRVVSIDGRDYHLGVLVQSNFGRTGDLMVNGFPLGQKNRKRNRSCQRRQGLYCICHCHRPPSVQPPASSSFKAGLHRPWENRLPYRKWKRRHYDRIFHCLYPSLQL